MNLSCFHYFSGINVAGAFLKFCNKLPSLGIYLMGIRGREKGRNNGFAQNPGLLAIKLKSPEDMRRMLSL